MEKKWIKIDDDSNFNPTWDYRTEPNFEGVFQGVETGVGPNKSNLYTFKKPDGRLMSVWGSTVLDKRLSTLTEGEEVRIEYLGDERTERGTTYHNFAVYKEELPTIEQ